MSQSMTALISSVNTRFYVISSPRNKDGQQVDTRDGKNSPSGSVRAQPFTVAFSNSSVTRDFFFGQILLITPGFGGSTTVATISSKDSDGRLFISLDVSLPSPPHLYNNYRLTVTNVGVRVLTTEPNLLGPTSHIHG